MSNKVDELVPEQETGAESNTEQSITLDSPAEARTHFELVSARLLDVNGWNELSGKPSADFQLTDVHGNDVDRPAQPGDHFRIDIPGPGPVTGKGYDWVQIEKIEVEQETEDGSGCTLMRVRPATNPTGGADDVAHFFSEEATSNFMVRLQGSVVTAAVYGRNELPNTNAVNAIDKARNTMVAVGAMAGVSKLQWKQLVKGLISK